MASLGQQINKKQEFCLLVAVIQLISSSDADSKESALSVGDLSSIPGSGGSPGDDNGNPLSILAWRIPWTEEPGRLQSMGSKRVGHDLATKPQQYVILCIF